jgi:hypothetical protein
MNESGIGEELAMDALRAAALASGGTARRHQGGWR